MSTAHDTAREPGQWPVPDPVQLDGPTATRKRGTYDRARFNVTLGAIRADLEEQPSERAVHAAARRWHEAITCAADDIVTELRRTG